MAADGAPSGQNQMKGIHAWPVFFRIAAMTCSIKWSTDRSTGQLGNEIFSQPFRRIFCNCFRTGTPIHGRSV